MGWGQTFRVPEESGIPFPSMHYAANEYRQYPQNWDIVQDKEGLVYAANNDGVLEYDGVRWRLIPVSENAIAMSLAIGASGAVHVGTQGDFGVLVPDSMGVLRYASLLEHVARRDRDFTEVWGTHAMPKGVYYQARERLFRWDGERVQSWASNEVFHTSFAVNGEFYVRDTEKGLLQMEGDSLVVAPGGEYFEDRSIYAMMPYDEDRILIGTSRGLLLYRDSTITPFESEVESYLERYKLYHGCALGRGYFALATMGGGVVVIDEQGQIIRVMNTESGLPDGAVNRVHRGREGELWMALNNSGIMRADALSPVSLYDERLGIEGTVRSIERQDGKLYVATGLGTFVLKEAQSDPEAQDGFPVGIRRPHFERVPGISPSFYLLSTDRGLFVASQGGTHIIRDGKASLIDYEIGLTLAKSNAYPGRIYVGSPEGLRVIEPSGDEWEFSDVPGIDSEIRFIHEDQSGRLWLVAMGGEIVRLKLNRDLSIAEIDRFGAEEGLPEGTKNVFSIGSDTFVLVDGRVFRVREEGRSILFILDPSLVPDGLSEDDPLLVIDGDEQGNLWAMSAKQVFRSRLTSDGTYGAWKSIEPLHFMKSTLFRLFAEDNGILWIGNGHEVLRYDSEFSLENEQPFYTLMRQITTIQDGDIIYGGAGGAKLLGPQGRAQDAIPHSENDLRFDVAAPVYETNSPSEYQYYMEGVDDAWTDWRDQANVVYTNLAEGTYELRARARNERGEISEVARFEFSVLPPWYRTWWAYIGYALILAVMGLGYQRYFEAMEENKLAKEQARELERERLANERLQQANERLQQANVRLHQANELKESFLASTSHELRTPLTNILGFTDLLREEVPNDFGRHLDVIESNGQRLLRTLNALLDLASLRSGEMVPEMEQVNLNNHLDAIVEEYDDDPRAAHLEVNLDVPEQALYAELDARYLEQIMRNLIDNAVKFTEEGSIDVRLEKDRGWANIVVADTGIGIDPDFLPELFKDFKQESRGLTRTYEGNGLGLAITARLVELMRGTVGVQSVKGSGSTFTVGFPLCTPKSPTQGHDAVRTRESIA